MSRRRRHHFHNRERFPRVSGDEPSDVNAYTAGAWFSPRERG